MFADLIASDSTVEVWAIPAPRGGSRAFCDRMNGWAQGQGQPGLGYVFWREGEEGGAGPIAKNLGAQRTAAIRDQLNLSVGDAVFFICGRPEKFQRFAGEARTFIGDQLGLVEKNQFAFCWVIDFPMYEWNDEEKKIDFSHNPFSMPQGGLEALATQDPLSILALSVRHRVQRHRIVFWRNSQSPARDDAESVLRLPATAKRCWKASLAACIAPSNMARRRMAGIAPGIDRIVMLLCGESNLREVVLFPMNQQAQDLLMGAPAEVSVKQLRELHIRLNSPVR